MIFLFTHHGCENLHEEFSHYVTNISLNNIILTFIVLHALDLDLWTNP